MTKRYKLLKDLPDSKPGDIYIWNDTQKAYYKDGNVLDSYWGKESVENNPTWFQEIKEPERIEVTGIDFLREPKKNRWDVEYKLLIHLSGWPVERDYNSYKQVIEDFLNGQQPVKGVDERFGKEDKKWKDAHIKKVCETTSEPPLYTQQQMDEAIEKAFYDGRTIAGGQMTGYMGNDLKYKTFQDYLSSLKNKL